MSGLEVEVLFVVYGFEFGYFLQSFCYVMIGGFVVVWFLGQNLVGNGCFDVMVIGIWVVMLIGDIEVGCVLGLVVGFDLVRIFLGLEGIFGIIIEVWVWVYLILCGWVFEFWIFLDFFVGVEGLCWVVQYGDGLIVI